MPDTPGAEPTRKQPAQPPRRRLISKREVCEKLGRIHPTTLWRYRTRPGFPQPVRLTPTRSMWFEDEIDAYMASLPRGPLGAEARGFGRSGALSSARTAAQSHPIQWPDAGADGGAA
jgi:predicted DNA-binding transcriptional regulator AlpA